MEMGGCMGRCVLCICILPRFIAVHVSRCDGVSARAAASDSSSESRRPPPNRRAACAMTVGSAGAKRQGRFVLGQGVPHAPPKKAPKVAALTIDDGALPPPPPATLELFAGECDHWVAVDIETHELVPASKDYFWVTGRYGHNCRVDSAALELLRVVHVGWCVGRFSSPDPPRVSQVLVRPEGFEISKAASAKHGITTERADSEGVPLREALEKLLADVLAVAQQGGRLCAHQLEFDCGVIALELHRTGLADKVEAWSEFATDGFCTMCPAVTKWACAKLFDVSGADSFLGCSRPVGLKDMVRALLPVPAGLLSQHHDAGADARMAWLVLRELFARARRAAVLIGVVDNCGRRARAKMMSHWSRILVGMQSLRLPRGAW